MTSFAGFPQDGIVFLKGITRNNDREWFEAHRDQYQQGLLEPAFSFVEGLGKKLQKKAPTIEADPRIGGSLFRIHRDTRFSKDKRPYKTHIGMRFRDSDFISSTKCDGPLMYVQIDANKLLLGAGIKTFDKPVLQAYRAEIDRNGKALQSLLDRLDKNGFEVRGEMLKRVPPKFDPDHAQADLLKRKGLFIALEQPLPASIGTKAFIDHCLKGLTPTLPIYRWLQDVAHVGIKSP